MVYYTYTVTRGGGRPTGAARWHAGSLTRTLSRTSAFARTLATLRGQREVAPRVPTTISSDPTADALPSHTFPRALYTHVSSLPPGSLISPQAPPLHRPPTHSLHASRSPRSIRSTALSLSFSLSISHEAAAARRLRAILARRTPHASHRASQPHAARPHARPTYISPLPLLHAVHRPPCAACRQSLVTLCPPPASRAHHLDEPNSTDRACPVTALAPLPRPSRATLNRLGSIRATPRWVASRHAASDRIVPRRLRDHAAPCWLVPCQHRQRAITSPTSLSLSLSLHSSHCHLSSATRRNFLRHGVILVYIQSHAHDLLPLPLPSPPFRLHGDNQARKNE